MINEFNEGDIPPLPLELSAETLDALERVDRFRSLWQEHLDTLTAEERLHRQQRNLRSHAIETGIIERLYDLDWGITEELIAEGLTLDVAEKQNGELSIETLETIQAQFDGLGLLLDFLQEKRELSTSFIKTLHATITATQLTYTARDQFGTSVERPLQRGAWKTEDNYIVRQDGSRISCTAPIHVQDQMDLLVALFAKYQSNQKIHPITLGAWTHHRFIQIHPFSDGNGRVARALLLLVLLQSRFSPVVVRRNDRIPYIEALDLANDGNLEPLIRYFARLETDAIRAELTYTESIAADSAIQVASQYVSRLKNKFEASDSERRTGVESLAGSLISTIGESLKVTVDKLEETVRPIDSNANGWLKSGVPKTEEGRYFHYQIVRAAREVDFFSNLEEGAWWVTLNLRVSSSVMRFGSVIQKVGRGESGILALTFFAEMLTQAGEPGENEVRPISEPLLKLRPSDAVNFLYTDNILDAKKSALHALESALTASVSAFFERLG